MLLGRCWVSTISVCYFAKKLKSWCLQLFKHKHGPTSGLYFQAHFFQLWASMSHHMRQHHNAEKHTNNVFSGCWATIPETRMHVVVDSAHVLGNRPCNYTELQYYVQALGDHPWNTHECSFWFCADVGHSSLQLHRVTIFWPGIGSPSLKHAWLY